jgi:hypothetical protein
MLGVEAPNVRNPAIFFIIIGILLIRKMLKERDDN